MIKVDLDPEGLLAKNGKVLKCQPIYSHIEFLLNTKVGYPPHQKEIHISSNASPKNKYLDIYDGEEILEQLKHIGKMTEENIRNNQNKLCTNKDSFIDNKILKFTKRWGFISLEEDWLAGMPVYEFKRYARNLWLIYNVWMNILFGGEKDVEKLKQKLNYRESTNKTKKWIHFDGDYIGEYPGRELTDKDIIEISTVWLLIRINRVIKIRYEWFLKDDKFFPILRPEDVLTLAYLSLVKEMSDKRIIPKLCKSCGSKFIAHRSNHLYCSDICKSEYKNRLKYQRRKTRAKYTERKKARK